MMSNMNQKAILIIVTLIIGKSLPTYEALFYSISAITLFWALCSQLAISSFLKRLFTKAPRGVLQPRPMPLCYVFDPESNTMTAVPRAVVMQLFDGRKDNPYA